MTSEPLIMTRSRLHVWFSTQLWKLRWRFATRFFGRQGDGKRNEERKWREKKRGRQTKQDQRMGDLLFIQRFL
ncbi:hypothetical protein H8958_014136, partial [Nasalis larvatus]